MKDFLDYICEAGNWSCFDYELINDDIMRGHKKILCKREKLYGENFSHITSLFFNPRKNIGWRFKYAHPISKIYFFLDFIPREIRHYWRFL